jgi:hypothetical protein
MQKPPSPKSTLATLSESQVYRDYQRAFTQGTRCPRQLSERTSHYKASYGVQPQTI